MRKSIWVFIVIVLVAGGWWLAKQPKTEGETIKLGAALGLSGICAEFGEGELKAVTLAVEEANKAGGVNGKQIELVSEDTLCENKGTVNATQKLLNVDKAVAIVGPTWGDSFQGGYPLAREAKIVSVSPSTAIEALEISGQPVNFAFSTWFPARRETDVLQKHILSKGLKKVMLVHDQDPFGIMSARVFEERAKQNGIEIIAEHEVAVETSDFRTIIAKVKEKKSDAVFASFITPESKAIFIQQARQLGIKTPVLSTAEIQNPSLLASFSNVLEGVIYTYPKGAEGFDTFASKYKGRFGVEPEGPSASNAYDAMNILVAAMRNAGTDGVALERELLSIELPGVTYDTLKFSEKHQIAGGEFEIKTVRNGQFVTVEP